MIHYNKMSSNHVKAGLSSPPPNVKSSSFVCAESSAFLFVAFLACYYLSLLTEVHIEDLGIARRPLDSVEGSSGSDSLVCCSVLRG